LRVPDEAESRTRWEHFSHDADVGVRGVGPSLDTAFAQAAVAMTAVITDPDLVGDENAIEIQCSADDAEMLLAEWLNALVYEMAVRSMLFARFEVRVSGTQLSATAWGEEVDVERHRPAAEVKGATLTALSVRETADGMWIAEDVVDV
jgi:tRNA nucleotidyltransferase (CCA-adding enzyme)